MLAGWLSAWFVLHRADPNLKRSRDHCSPEGGSSSQGSTPDFSAITGFEKAT